MKGKNRLSTVSFTVLVSIVLISVVSYARIRVNSTAPRDNPENNSSTDAPNQVCDSPVSVKPPLTIFGDKERCMVISEEISYVNSWNMELVEINGEDYTNTRSDRMPARINGNYYIYYVGNSDLSHLEINSDNGKNSPWPLLEPAVDGHPSPL